MRGQRKQPAPGGDASRMRGVIWKEGLFLEVDEGTGELNERLVIAFVRILAPQPEMLEHVVGFIKLSVVKTGEKGSVFSGKLRFWVG